MKGIRWSQQYNPLGFVFATTGFGCLVASRPQTRRNLRTVTTAVNIIRRYRGVLEKLRREKKLSDLNLVTRPERFEALLSPVHEVSAEELAHLCEVNGGAYIKAAQFTSVRSDIPVEYQRKLSRLQDEVTAVSFEKVDEVFFKAFGCGMKQAFTWVETEARCAGSLAQVHKATTLDGKDVVVKIQFPGVARQCKEDLRLLSLIARVADLAFRNQGVATGWIVSCMKKYLQAELNFKIEGSNMKRVAESFAAHKKIRIPGVMDSYSSERVITMEFIEGKRPTRETLDAYGIEAEEFAETLGELNARMCLHNRLVHCDLHPGNMIVTKGKGGDERKGEGGSGGEDGEGDWKVYLIDHGMYCEVNEVLHKKLCKLWLALCDRSHGRLVEACESLGVSEDLAMFYPLLFEGDHYPQKRAWNCLPKKLKSQMMQRISGAKENKSLLKEILTFARSVPEELLLLQRANILHHFLLEDVLAADEQQQKVKVNDRRLEKYWHFARQGLAQECLPRDYRSAIQVTWNQTRAFINDVKDKCKLFLSSK